MPSIPARTCGTTGPLNVSALMPALVPMRWPGVRQVANRSFMPEAASLMPPAAVRSELVDWGTAIVAIQAAQAAERLVPGISAVHHACQLYRMLTAAQQGDLLRALQQMPLGAVIPARIAEYLRGVLPSFCVSATGSVPDHDCAVLLLATGALLCHLSTAPMPTQPPATHSAALHVLRCARASLEGLRGLRSMLSLPRAAGNVGLLASEAHRQPRVLAPLPVNLTMRGNVRRAGLALRTAVAPARRDDVPASAWPFPGAAAAPMPGKKDGASPPVKSQTSTQGQANTGQASGLKRSNAIRRRGKADGKERRGSVFNTEHAQPRGNQASRNPAAIAGHAEGAKESMQNPLKHAVQGYGAGDGYMKREEPLPPERPDVAAAHVLIRNAGSAAGRAADAEAGASGQPGPLAVPEDNTPVPTAECIQFDDIRVLSLLVRSRRYQTRPMHVCVQPALSPLFKEWATLPADSHRGMGRWMVSEAIHEDIPHALRATPIRRFGAAVETTLGTVPMLEPIGTDRLFTLLTMSLLDGPLRREAGNRTLPRMQANSFRVLKHKGFDGVERNYLAYFLRRDSVSERGVRGGFLEIWPGPGGTLGVDDTVHGIRITSATLDGLVATLEKLTGLRYLGARRHAALQATPSPATNLFVDESQLMATRSPRQHLPFNHALQLFAPVTLELNGPSERVSLYHGSFMLLDDVLVYSDEAGQGGMVHFGRHRVGGGGARQLRCLTSADCAFVTRHGLQQGVFYTRAHIRQVLQERGLVSLRDPASSDAILLLPKRHASTTPDPWPAPIPARSTFGFEDGSLHYVDHDGKEGSVDFEHVPRMAIPRYRLSSQLLPAQHAFAARNNFVPDTLYSEGEIEWLLAGQGYIRRPE